MQSLLTKNKLEICCIGAGYVGGPSMAVLAKKCKSLRINVVDVNQKRINAWNDSNLDNLPIYENKLKEIIKETRGRNLFFTTNVSKVISNSDIIFICVNTPTKERGLGSGKASDLKWVEICAREVSKYARNHTIVIEKSTVPVKTAEVIKTILNENSKYEDDQTKTFSVLSNPEFLSEGNAINDLENPDRVLIGGDDEDAKNLLSSIYEKWIEKSKIIKTNLWSSELSKLTSNAFLAQRISSINSISALCEKTGANIQEVAKAIGADKRIGDKFLEAGPGFGGSCFKKDILNLVYLCEYFDLKEVANYWEGVLKINEWQQNRISEIVVKKLFNTLSGKKIAILGFTFKANTNDIRESPAINICKNLMQEGAFISIHDPKADKESIKKEFEMIKNLSIADENNFKEGENWEKCSSLVDTISNSASIIILTDWEEYKNIEWDNYENVSTSNSWIFDARILLNKKIFEKSKFNYWGLGYS